MGLHWTALMSLAALLVYCWMFFNAGMAREKYKVKAPSMDGPIEFQSAQRVQANTVEQMVMFFPALWMCGFLLSDMWAGIGGLVWVIGRIVYALAYYKDPSKRTLGFMITSLGSVGLTICAGIGLILRWS